MPTNMGPFENAADENGQTLLFLGETVPTWFPLTRLQPGDLATGIATANRTENDLSPCEQGPRHLACFAFDLAAADALGKYDERHYNGSTEGKTLAKLAARMAAICRERYHPHVTTCRALRTVALASVGNDVEFARRWLTEKNILRGIPKGHYSDPVVHHLLEATQFTVRDLAGLPTEDTPALTTILNRLNSRLNNIGSGGQTVYRDEAISLMGLYGWVKAIKISRTAGDTEEFSNVFKVATELLQDTYLTPALAWVRTAYAMRIIERKQPNQ